jgi:hypothetical protein
MRVYVLPVRRIVVAATLLLALLGPVASTAHAHRQDSDKGCNVRLKGLKTLSDPQRKLVNLHPKNTTAGPLMRCPSFTRRRRLVRLISVGVFGE